MSPPLLRAILAGLGLAACAPAWSQVALEPGLWRIKVASTSNGKPEPPQDDKVCLQDELKDLAKYFSPELEGVQAECTRTKRPVGGPNELAYRMSCKGNGFTTEMNSTVTIVSPKQFKLYLRMDTRTRKETAKVVADGEATHLGPCPEAATPTR
jgi:hypothetical protein